LIVIMSTESTAIVMEPGQQQHQRQGSSLRREYQYQTGMKPQDNNDEGNGFCAAVLVFLSWVFILAFLPFSLCMSFKIVQEYERAVIFRLGRLVKGEQFTQA
jgi:hypothetical protein